MKKSNKLKVTKSNPKDLDFYNLFQPIIPAFLVVGVVAQILSGATESVVIAQMLLKEFQHLPPFVAYSLVVLLVAMAVCVLELGLRKFLQVLTRVIVWKRFSNHWYIALFSVVLVVTIGICYVSFTLSTKAVKMAFTGGGKGVVDTSVLDAKLRKDIQNVKTDMDMKKASAIQSHISLLKATRGKHDARIKQEQVKLDKQRQNVSKGLDWAKSHVTKHTLQIARLMKLKADAVENVAQSHKEQLDEISTEKDLKINRLNQLHESNVIALEEQQNDEYTRANDKARFYGQILSMVVGLCVLLAFVSIVVVEMFNRGSEMELQYKTVEVEPHVVTVLFARFSAWFRGLLLNRNYKDLSVITKRSAPIGFKTGGSSSLSDDDIIRFAIRNVKNTISVYRNKADTENNRQRIAEWECKLQDLERLSKI